MVHHSIILRKLQNFGISHDLVLLIKSLIDSLIDVMSRGAVNTRVPEPGSSGR
jgi:hypothetical protein